VWKNFPSTFYVSYFIHNKHIDANAAQVDKYKQDLNPDNPLAYHGEVAKAYANLLTQIYSENAPASFAPRQIKATIGKYGSSFSGYGQQDSQEFLGFLLDGLQEDLNRVLKKPYIEKPDSTDEMVHDPVALQAMADKCWEIYKARSDSVITDLFGGMYKSTVVCPVCDKVSIIFDPFNNLTLQIPVENLWTKEIFYFPLYQRPIRVGVDIDKNSSIFALKQYVATRMKSDPKKLIMAEIYKFKVYKMFSNIQSIAEAQIGMNDDIAIYEVEDIPTNYNPDKIEKPRFSLYSSSSDDDDPVPSFDSPKCDKMLVPIFNRCEKPTHTRAKQIFGSPSYTVITREEAQDLDMIRRKVIAEVATMTTLDIIKEAQDSDSEDELAADPDTVIMNEEDYSSSDSKVHAASVEGEESLVDVSMRDDEEATQATENSESQRPKPLPRILNRNTHIPAKLQNLFDIKVFKTDQAVAIGWSAVDDHKEYTSMASRAPMMQHRPIPARRGLLNGDESSVNSDEDIDDPPQAVTQRLPRNEDDSDYDTSSQPKNESESSNDEELPSAKSIFDNGRLYNGRNSRGQLTYSKKGKKIINKKQRQEPGPYIRPGEGIILEWKYEAYDTLFGADGPDDMRGLPTWSSIDLFPDPELEKKRALRTMRRKKGFSLDDCLDEFGRAEILSENDAWYCPRCKEHRRASKKFELWKAPDILVIHFKRFSANRGFRDKLDLLVDFPVEGLDLTNRVAMHEDKSLIYDLIAVDNHYGGLGGGHYTAFAKNFVDGNWYEYNG
jgi:ubiquitin carboxyl-terminal hydrolase 4/11/15